MNVYLLMRPEFGCCDNEWEEVVGVFATAELAMSTHPPKKEGRRATYGWVEQADGEWHYVRTDVKRPYREFGNDFRVVPTEVVGP